ncbi:MAG: hypothetical protein Q8865_01420 [Bacillota bacterium]|nr:hypothetical protein [Bacillota bacterium]
MNTEELLPVDILNKAFKPGLEYAWKFEDIPSVVAECEKLGLAVTGGEVQFFVQKSTCDLYWLSAGPKDKTPEENWATFCKRSYREFLESFNDIITNTDFEQEGIKSFHILYDLKREGVDICQYLCFTLRAITENEYYKLKAEYAAYLSRHKND